LGGRLFTLGYFLKNHKSRPNFGATFYHRKSCVMILTKKMVRATLRATCYQTHLWTPRSELSGRGGGNWSKDSANQTELSGIIWQLIGTARVENKAQDDKLFLRDFATVMPALAMAVLHTLPSLVRHFRKKKVSLLHKQQFRKLLNLFFWGNWKKKFREKPRFECCRLESKQISCTGAFSTKGMVTPTRRISW
jgi:hypothetical protein